MKTIGRIFGIISAVGMVLAFLPLLGWLNWLLIPIAIIGLIFSLIGKSTGGIILCITAIVIGIFRLNLGGGIF